MNKPLSISVLTAAIVLLLPACDKLKNVADEASSKVVEQSADITDAVDQDAAWNEKVNEYIEVANRMRGALTGGDNPAIQRWVAEADAKVQAGDFKAIRTDSHYYEGRAIDTLKQTMASPGKTEGADNAAKALIAAIEKHLPNWKALESYNKAKKYEDDAGAEGKRLLPAYVEGQTALRSTLENFNREVDLLSREMHDKSLAEYRKEGKLLEMHTLEALSNAEKIIDTFDDEGDFKDKAKLDTANAALAALDTSIAGMRAEHAKRKAGAEQALPRSDMYSSVADTLEEVGGAYREARKNPSNFNRVVESYNRAIDNYNRMQ